jgi:hypothetical protein
MQSGDRAASAGKIKNVRHNPLTIRIYFIWKLYQGNMSSQMPMEDLYSSNNVISAERCLWVPH